MLVEGSDDDVNIGEVLDPVETKFCAGSCGGVGTGEGISSGEDVLRESSGFGCSPDPSPGAISSSSSCCSGHTSTVPGFAGCPLVTGAAFWPAAGVGCCCVVVVTGFPTGVEVPTGLCSLGIC